MTNINTNTLFASLDKLIEETFNNAKNNHIWALGSATQEESLEHEKIVDKQYKLVRKLKAIKTSLEEALNISKSKSAKKYMVIEAWGREIDEPESCGFEKFFREIDEPEFFDTLKEAQFCVFKRFLEASRNIDHDDYERYVDSAKKGLEKAIESLIEDGILDEENNFIGTSAWAETYNHDNWGCKIIEVEI